MRKQTKIVLWTVGAATAAFAAYKAYKYYQEQQELEAQALDINDVKAYAEAKRMDELTEARENKLNAGIDDEDTELAEDGWYTNHLGILERKLTREEMVYGADYDMLTEELIENEYMNGEVHTVIRKRAENILLNHREKRGVSDVIDSVEDMASQIRSLRNVDMEFEKRIYERDTLEALDYYIALLMDRAGVHSGYDREKLIVLSTYEYTPNVYDDNNHQVLENIRNNRYQHLGVSPHTTWGSIAEVIIYYAELLHFNVDDVSTQEYISNMLEYMGVDYDDRDVVINDIIVSYFEHNRRNKPNYDGTFGLFGITETQYNESTCLNDEYEFFLGNQTRLHGEIKDGDIV
ncbi:MAG: hypothetical protein EOM35_09210 [Negativicutes bacterium]|nr:hypothetical protein [Negativicutes bacterium]